MDPDPRNPLLNLTYFCKGRSAEEQQQMLLCTNVQLQAVRLQAQEEMRKRDDELKHFRSILSKAVKERDEARDKFQRLLLEKFTQHKELKQVVKDPASGVKDDVKRGLDSNNGVSSSKGDDSIVSSPVIDTLPPPPQPELQFMMRHSVSSSHEEMMELLLHEKRALPEKGKLLDAVMNAGPLLQILLLAGPLPQWTHPHPPLESSQISPVPIPPPELHSRGVLSCVTDYSSDSGRLDRKRSLLEGSAYSTKTKYHRILLN